MTNPIVNLIRMAGIATPYAVRVAATLRLPQPISEGSTRIDELAARAHANPDALGRLSHLLVLREVCTESEPGTFGLTEIGRLLVDDDPLYLRAGFEVFTIVLTIEVLRDWRAAVAHTVATLTVLRSPPSGRASGRRAGRCRLGLVVISPCPGKTNSKESCRGFQPFLLRR